MSNTIGLGIITCDRFDYLKQCLEAVKQNRELVNWIVVVNDGQNFTKEQEDIIYGAGVNNIIQHSPPYRSVGVAKNQALRWLMVQGCDHLFILENDIIIKRADVFHAYIKAAEVSGIWHMNFSQHGPANKKPNTEEKNPRQVVDYGNGLQVALYPHCVGAFSYFYRGVIKAVGYHDERFKNAFEHVEHTYRIIKKDLHPPFWWFADLPNSEEYLTEIPGSIQNSSIPHTKQWISNFQRANGWFEIKHGYAPTQVPDIAQEIVLEKIQNLEKNYARKVL